MNAPAQRNDVYPVQRLQHHVTGQVIYLPYHQEFVDTPETLERDQLVHFEYDEHGKCSAILTLVSEYNIRVLCWKATVNEAARARGAADVFPNLPVDFFADVTDRIQ